MKIKISTFIATDPDLHVVLDSTEMHRIDLYSPATCKEFYKIKGRFGGNGTWKFPKDTDQNLILEIVQENAKKDWLNDLYLM